MTIVFYYESPSFQTQFEKFEKLFYSIHNHTANSLNKEEFEKKKKNLNKYLDMFKIGIYNATLGFNSTAFIEESHFDNKNLWLIKATDLNRGRCIKIANKINDMKNIIKNFSEGISREPKADSEEEENKCDKNKKVKNASDKNKKKENKNSSDKNTPNRNSINKKNKNEKKSEEKNNEQLENINSNKDEENSSDEEEEKPKKKKIKKI